MNTFTKVRSNCFSGGESRTEKMSADVAMQTSSIEGSDVLMKYCTPSEKEQDGTYQTSSH